MAGGFDAVGFDEFLQVRAGGSRGDVAMPGDLGQGAGAVRPDKLLDPVHVFAHHGLAGGNALCGNLSLIFLQIQGGGKP